MPKLCIVVPVYNHGRQLGGTLAKLSQYDLPIILVDDGSDTDTQEAIKKAQDNISQVIAVETLTQNMGKGEAVTTGARKAQSLGYTHIFQIDADGQHDSADIPKFIAKMEQNPTALVSGMPIYDESIPKSRLHGRKITNFWVAIETWTTKITEAMCGFRIYPLDSYLELANRKAFANRMDYDIDVIVRMYWRGVDICFIDTAVIYPEDGHSNFRMFKDNVRISSTHTRLVFGMLLRSPILLWRKIK